MTVSSALFPRVWRRRTAFLLIALLVVIKLAVCDAQATSPPATTASPYVAAVPEIKATDLGLLLAVPEGQAVHFQLGASEPVSLQEMMATSARDLAAANARIDALVAAVAALTTAVANVTTNLNTQAAAAQAEVAALSAQLADTTAELAQVRASQNSTDSLLQTLGAKTQTLETTVASASTAIADLVTSTGQLALEAEGTTEALSVAVSDLSALRNTTAALQTLASRQRILGANHGVRKGGQCVERHAVRGPDRELAKLHCRSWSSDWRRVAVFEH